MDITKLTLGDIAEIEELSGHPFADLSEEDGPKGRLLTALAFVVMRKKDKTFTYDQAKNFTMSDIETLLAPGDAEKKD